MLWSVGQSKDTKEIQSRDGHSPLSPLKENKHDKLEEQHDGELYDGYHFFD